jgi:hypothetical protein
MATITPRVGASLLSATGTTLLGWFARLEKGSGKARCSPPYHDWQVTQLERNDSGSAPAATISHYIHVSRLGHRPPGRVAHPNVVLFDVRVGKLTANFSGKCCGKALLQSDRHDPDGYRALALLKTV